jgi:hypothetical protein
MLLCSCHLIVYDTGIVGHLLLELFFLSFVLLHDKVDVVIVHKVAAAFLAASFFHDR